MMKNKSLVLWIATIAMLSFVFAGYAGGPVNEAEEGEKPNLFVEIAAQQTEMTEDIFVEITAQQIYLSEKYSEEIEAAKLMTKIEEEMNKIYKEHGVTEEEYYQFAEKYEEDDAIRVMERVNERVEELKAEDE